MHPSVWLPGCAGDLVRPRSCCSRCEVECLSLSVSIPIYPDPFTRLTDDSEFTANVWEWMLRAGALGAARAIQTLLLAVWGTRKGARESARQSKVLYRGFLRASIRPISLL